MITRENQIAQAWTDLGQCREKHSKLARGLQVCGTELPMDIRVTAHCAMEGLRIKARQAITTLRTLR